MANDKDTTGKKKKGPISDNSEKNQPEASTQDPFIVYGATGDNLQDGFLKNDYSQELNGIEGAKIFDQMRSSDTQVEATMTVVELPIIGADWRIDPAKDENGKVDAQDQKIADFVQVALFEKLTPTWENFMRTAVGMVQFGFSLFEVQYEIEEFDGTEMVFIRELESRAQDTIEKWQTEEGDPGVTQQLPVAATTGVNKGKTNPSIPNYKLLLFSYRRTGDNYAGVSALRAAHRNWFYKDPLLKFDAMGHERASVGVPVIYAPGNITDSTKKACEKIVRNLRASQASGVFMPGTKDEGWLIEMLDLKSAGQSKPLESAVYHDLHIARSLLAQFINNGSLENGSRAMDESQKRLFLSNIESIAKDIASVINRDLITELVDFNFPDVDRYPTLEFDRLGDVDYLTLSEVYKNAIAAGVITTDLPTEQEARKKLGLSPKQEETETDNPKPKTKEPTKEEKDASDKAKATTTKEPLEFMDHDEEMEFKEFNDYTNTDVMIKLNNEARTQKDKDALKKKGFVVNPYEKESPRLMTFAEKKVNFKALQSKMRSMEKTLDVKVVRIAKQMKKELIDQTKDIIKNNKVNDINKITVSGKPELSQAMTDASKDGFEVGKESASSEMGVKKPPTKPETKGMFRAQNDAEVDKIITDLTNTTKTSITQSIANNDGLITETGVTATVQQVRKNVDVIISKLPSRLNALAVALSVNTGRGSIFNRHPEKVYAVQYSAILDDRTTDLCLSLDGRIVRAGSTAYQNHNPPNHYNCRSIWVEILQEETFKPRITGIPKSIPITPTIQNAPKMLSPNVLKNSPATKVLKEELDVLEDKLADLIKRDKFPNRQASLKKRINRLKSSLKGKFYDLLKEDLRAQGIKFKDDE